MPHLKNAYLKPIHAVAIGVLLTALCPVMSMAQNIDQDSSSLMVVEPSKSYGDFIIGRVAITNSKTDQAANAWMKASLADPEDMALRKRALMGAFLSGHLDYVVDNKLGESQASPLIRYLQSLALGARAIKDENPSLALDNFNAAIKLNGGDKTGILLRPYVLAMSGQWDEATLLSAKQAKNDARLELYNRLIRAHLFELHGRPQEALTLYRALYQPGAQTSLVGPDYARFLWRQGTLPEAIKVAQEIKAMTGQAMGLEALLSANPPTDNKSAPAIISLNDGAAQAAYYAATLYASEQQDEYSLVDLHMARYLSAQKSVPYDRASLLLGVILDKMEDRETSRQVLSEINPNNEFGRNGAELIAQSYITDGHYAKAMAILKPLSLKDPENLDLVLKITDILRQDGAYSEGLGLINDYRTRYGEKAFTWQAYYVEAILFDLADQWPNAEKAIEKARRLEPERAEILNFLGYGWIDKKTNIAQGMALIKKALKSNPQSGAMMDSLGWGYYRLGNYEEALNWIEKAILAEPANAELTEHLGDIYAALGRKREAGYEWNRVLGLEPNAKQRARVEAKLGKSAVMPSVVAVAKSKQDSAVR